MGCKPTARIPWDQFGAPSLVTEQENYVHEIIRCDVDGLRDIHSISTGMIGMMVVMGFGSRRGSRL